MKIKIFIATLLFIFSIVGFTKIDRNPWKKSLHTSVFEVVTPKIEDEHIIYKSALPFEKLNFKERTDKYISFGTAFTIEKGRYISANHVFNPLTRSANKKIYLRDQEGKVYEVNKVTRLSLADDLIEFTLNQEPANVTQLKRGTLPEIGDDVFSAGNAQGEGIAVRGGQVSSFTLEHEQGLWKYIRFSAPASPGNSGGPLVNAQGEVVGVIAMKNGNENLNYAIPLSELDKLPKDRALFFKKNMPNTLFVKSTLETLDISSPLPATLAELHSDSAKKLDDKIKEGVTKIRTQFSGEIFPNGHASEIYLREQAYYFYLSSIDVDSSGNWGLTRKDLKVYPMANERKLYFAQSRQGSFTFVMQKPKGTTLEAFFLNPKQISEELFAIVPVFRSMAGEKIRIQSYGIPHDQRRYTDVFGRPWHTSTWRFQHSHMSTIMGCTPVPVGVACSYTELPTSSETDSVYDLAQELNFTEALSYFGTLRQWTDFFNMNKALIPGVFKTSELRGDLKSRYQYSVGKFSAEFNDPNINMNSFLTVGVGFSITRPLTAQIQMVSLKPHEDSVADYTTVVSFKPLDDMSTDAKNRWTMMSQKTKPFDDQLFQGQKSLMMIKNIKQNEQEIFVSSCIGEPSSEKSEVEKKCRTFFTSSSIKD